MNRSLAEGKKLIEAGVRDAAQIKQRIEETIGQEKLAKIDYVELVDFADITPIGNLSKAKEGEVLCAIAVFIGKTRLIDNFIWKGFGD